MPKPQQLRRYDLFCRGSDNALWTTSVLPSGPTNEWSSLGGAAISSPAAAAVGGGRVVVLVVGTDGKLYRRDVRNGAPDGDWKGPYASPSGGIKGSPALASFEGKLSAFVVNNGGRVWNTALDNIDWKQLSTGYCVSDPSAASTCSDRDSPCHSVACYGTDQQVWYYPLTAIGQTNSGWIATGLRLPPA